MIKITSINELILLSKAVGNPIRISILIELSEEGCYVSKLARKLNIGRALLYLHLNKLEEAQLIRSEMKLSSDGKALKYYYVNSFEYLIDNALIKFLSTKNSED